MEIILKQDVDNIGYKNQIVNVKAGYANNFLVPQGLATVATTSARKMHAENIKQQAHKEAKRIDDATIVAKKIEGLNIVIKAKANETGKIFGTVTTADVANAITKQGVQVDRKDIKLENIKEIGSHQISIRVYKDVKATLDINVVA